MKLAGEYPLLGTFSVIDWLNGPLTELDPSGNSKYSVETINQFLSVPYTLHAKTAESIPGDAATRAYVDALLARIEEIEKHLDLNSGVFIDPRDGIQYKVVEIGDQIWMAENLKYLPEVIEFPNMLSYNDPNTMCNGTIVSEAKATDNYNSYGVLYNWIAAMDGEKENNLNSGEVKGVCPNGWHLPSMDEWKQMIDYLGGEELAGKKLMAPGTTHWIAPNSVATNE